MKRYDLCPLEYKVRLMSSMFILDQQAPQTQLKQTSEADQTDRPVVILDHQIQQFYSLTLTVSLSSYTKSTTHRSTLLSKRPLPLPLFIMSSRRSASQASHGANETALSPVTQQHSATQAHSPNGQHPHLKASQICFRCPQEKGYWPLWPNGNNRNLIAKQQEPDSEAKGIPNSSLGLA